MPDKPTYTMPIIGLIVALLAVAGIVAFALSQQKAAAPAPSQDGNQPQSATSQQQQPTSDAATFTYTSRGFEPASLTVKAGAVITVKNTSSQPMQFSSADHPTHRINPELNLSVLAPGQSITFTPSKIGTWGIHDHLNADNTATLVVTE